jgi:hypothetical protein
MNQSTKPASIKFSSGGDNKILVDNYLDLHGIILRDTVAIIHSKGGGLEYELLAPLGPGAKAEILGWWEAEKMATEGKAEEPIGRPKWNMGDGG